MGSVAPPPAPPPAKTSIQKDVRRMLILFALLGVAGVILLAFSVALGLIVLVVAEIFFAMAFRKFSRRSAKE